MGRFFGLVGILVAVDVAESVILQQVLSGIGKSKYRQDGSFD